MYYLGMAFAIISYLGMGLLFIDVVRRHIESLERKVAKVDVRFCDKLWLHMNLKKPNVVKIKMLSYGYWIVWPVTCMVSMYKAESEYSIVMHHWTVKRSAL